MNKKNLKRLSCGYMDDNNKKLESIVKKCSDRNLQVKIDGLKRMLQNQGWAETEDGIEKDDFLSAAIEKLDKAVSSESWLIADLHCKKIESLLLRRGEICPNLDTMTPKQKKEKARRDKARVKRLKEREKRKKKGLPIADLYSADELNEEFYAAALDDYAKIENEKRICHDKLSANPNDRYAQTQWGLLKIKSQGAKECCELYENEMTRNVLAKSMGQLPAMRKEAIARREISDDMFKVIVEEYNKTKEEMVTENSGVQDIVNQYVNGTSIGQEAAAQDGTVRGTAAAGQTDVRADAIFNDPEFQAFGKVPNAEEQKMQEILDSAESTIAQLNASIRLDDRQIEKSNSVIKDYEAQLRTLLKKRDNANANDCISLDGEISHIAGLMESEKKNVKRFVREKENTSKAIRVMMGLKGVKNVQQAQAMWKESFGDQSNLADVAMFIKNFDEEKNAEFTESEIILDTADGAEIETDTAPSTQALKNELEQKDEHKFDDLKKMLGLGGNGNES